MRLFGLVVLIAALSAASAPGDDPIVYSLVPVSPLYALKKDDKVRVVVAEKTTTKLTVTKDKDAVTSETETEAQYDFTDTIKEATGNKATKLDRHYTKALIGTKDADGKVTKDTALEGKTLAVQKKGNQYEFNFTGSDFGKPEGAAKEALEAEFNKPDKDLRFALFPKVPVKTGDTWTINRGEWAQTHLAGPEVVVEWQAVKGQGKVGKAENRAKKDKDKKVYVEPDKYYGEIVADFEVPILRVHLGEKPDPATALKADKGSKVTGKIESKGMADGTLPQNTTVTLTFDVSGKMDGCDVKLVVTSTEKRTMELLPKK